VINFGFFKKNQHLIWQTVPELRSRIDALTQEIQVAEQQCKIFDEKIVAALRNLKLAKQYFANEIDRIQAYLQVKIAAERAHGDLVRFFDKGMLCQDILEDFEELIVELDKQKQALIEYLWRGAPHVLSESQLTQLHSHLEKAKKTLIAAEKLGECGYQHGMDQLVFYWQTYTQLSLIFATLSFVILYVYIGVQTSASLILLIITNFASIVCLAELYQTHLSQEQLIHAYKALP
jgi:hypothetical protein